MIEMFKDSPLLKEHQDYFSEKFFLFAAKTIFGVMPENVDALSITDIFVTIIHRYPKLTVNDLQNAFRSHQQHEKVFVLTREIFIAPIAEYIRKKSIVTTEITKQIERKHVEQSVAQKEIEFKNKSKEIYLKSLKEGKWIGDCFNASSIGINFRSVISDEDRAEWKRRALELQLKLRAENKNNIMFIELPWEKHYANIAMEELIKRGQKFIQI